MARSYKSLDKLEKELQAVGASLDRLMDAAYCDAPSGYVWKATGTTSIPIMYGNGSQTWLTEELRDAYVRLQEGLQKVVDQEEILQHQHDLDDPNWGASQDAPDFIEFKRLRIFAVPPVFCALSISSN